MIDPKIASSRGKGFALVAVIFISGMVTGALGYRLADRYYLQRPPADTLNQEEKVFAVQHLSQELSLDDAQSKQIEAILDEFIKQQTDLMAQFRNSRVSNQDRIIHVLNDDQRRRYEKIVSQLNSRRRD